MNNEIMQISKDASSADIVDLINLKLEQARAMALVVGSEGFGDWSEDIRNAYGMALAHLIDVADMGVDELKDRNVDAK